MTHIKSNKDSLTNGLALLGFSLFRFQAVKLNCALASSRLGTRAQLAKPVNIAQICDLVTTLGLQ